MTRSGEVSSDRYDVVVVGAGMGGLTAAALLAKKGRKVLVVEQEDAPGGHARTFRRGAYSYDRALHLIMGCAVSSRLGIGVIDDVLRHLRVRDRCEFLRVDPFFTAHFPGFRMQVPGDRDAYLRKLIAQFPSEAKGITRLTELCAEVYREMLEFPILPGIPAWILTPVKHPRLFRYANSTLKAALDAHVSDPRLKALLSALWGYLGAPPSRVSFLLWAVMMASYIEEGAFYCAGGFQRLADAVAASLVENGGELALGQRPRAIRVENRRVQGIELADGRAVAAPVVISNIDARQTFAELIQERERPRSWIRKMERMTLSPFAAKIYLGTDLDLSGAGLSHENTVYRTWDMEASYADMVSRQAGDLFITIPTMTDKSLAPAGKHVVILTALVGSDVPVGMSESLECPAAQLLLAGAEAVLPGLRDHITDVGGSSVVGPMYGWGTTPPQSGAFRLSPTTPISGLYLCGQWTQPGHGVWTVVLSGARTARLIDNEQTSRGMIPLAS